MTFPRSHILYLAQLWSKSRPILHPKPCYNSISAGASSHPIPEHSLPPWTGSNTANTSTKAICGSSYHFLYEVLCECHQQSWLLSVLMPKHFASIAEQLFLAIITCLAVCPIRLKSLKDEDCVSYSPRHLWCPEQCLACSGNSINVDWMSKWTTLGNTFPPQEAGSGADGQSGPRVLALVSVPHFSFACLFPQVLFLCLNICDVSC